MAWRQPEPSPRARWQSRLDGASCPGVARPLEIAFCRTALVRPRALGYSLIIDNVHATGNTMHTTVHLKNSLKALALLGCVVLATLIVIQVQQAPQAPLLLSQASMLLPAMG